MTEEWSINNPFELLEAAVEHDPPAGVTLSAEQVRQIILRRNWLIENKNEVVSENIRLTTMNH